MTQLISTEASSHISLGDFNVLNATADAVAKRLLDRLQLGTQTVLFFANTNFIVQCIALKQSMADPDIVIVNDGVGMDLAASVIHGKRFLDNLNGTDFIPLLCRQARRPLRIFLLGGKRDVLQKAADYARDHLGQEIVGMCDGYDGIRQTAALVNTINQSQADLVLVALGNPIQEKWILDHCKQLNAKILTGVGALFDFWAGNKPRAPLIARKLRMEWFYRLCLEPRRLLRRYTVDIARFALHCYRHRHH